MLRIILIATLAISSAAAEVSVPKGATEVEPGLFKHTDGTGKTYLYRKTPFGVVKSSPGDAKKAATPAESARKSDAEAVSDQAPTDKAASNKAATASPFGNVKAPAKQQSVKVTERGNVLEFERPSPFGSYRWTRKKEELTEEERQLWKQAHPQQATATPAGPNE